MVITILESVVIMMTTLFVCSQAFWWSSPTTESTPAIRQIPVGYFRTYTYQPLSYPPMYSKYHLPSYNGPNQLFNAGSDPFSSWPQRQSFTSPSQIPALSAFKLTTSPPPSSTTPVTTQPPPTPPSSPQPSISSYAHMNPSSQMPIQSQQYNNLPVMEAHPPSPSSPTIQIQQLPSTTAQAGNNIPSYYSYQSPPDSPASNYHNYYPGNIPSSPYQQIQFIPCMCPVSVSVSSDLPENRSDNLDDEILERNGGQSKEDLH